MTFELSDQSIIEAARPLIPTISMSQAAQLKCYAELLLKWNSVYNLTSIRAPEEVLTLHLLDSLSMVASFNDFAPNAIKVLDVGRGGGLPAIPLAIMRPDLHVTMVDAVQKKIIFLRQAIVTTKLRNAKAVHARIEKLEMNDLDVVTCRAFSSLSDFVSWTRHLIQKPSACWLAMKGRMPFDELQELPEDVEVFKTSNLQVPNARLERHLIGMKIKSL